MKRIASSSAQDTNTTTRIALPVKRMQRVVNVGAKERELIEAIPQA